MKIAFSPYSLVPNFSLNRQMRLTPRKGALLRVTFESNLTGYADLAPIPEIGDRRLEEQFQLMSRGELTAQSRISLSFAKKDARARLLGESLWNGLKIPQSHYLISELGKISTGELATLFSNGFKKFKIKVGRNVEEELFILNIWAKELRWKGAFRLDFNGAMNSKDLEYFLKSASKELIQAIDFIEDPTSNSPKEWFEISDELNWAVDLVKKGNLSDQLNSKLIRVIKPAIQSCSIEVGELQPRLLFTSYVDHPVGQLFAAWTAAKYALANPNWSEICGLMSHQAFIQNKYSALLKSEGPRLFPPEGHGIGFDNLLEEEQWEPLC